MSPLQQAFLYSIAPVVASIGGSIFAAYKQPSAGIRNAIQHLASGVIFAVAAVELLPEIQEASVAAVLAGGAAGVFAMIILRWAGRKLESRSQGEAGLPTALLATTGVDLAIDGLLLGLGVVAGANLGLILTVALTLEVLFIGVAATATMQRRGLARRWSVGVPSALVFLLMAGAVLGATLFKDLSGPDLAALLSFGTVALLYLVTEELLVEAHEVEETPFASGMFFVGFLSFLAFEMIAE